MKSFILTLAAIVEVLAGGSTAIAQGAPPPPGL